MNDDVESIGIYRQKMKEHFDDIVLVNQYRKKQMACTSASFYSLLSSSVEPFGIFI